MRVEIFRALFLYENPTNEKKWGVQRLFITQKAEKMQKKLWITNAHFIYMLAFASG